MSYTKDFLESKSQQYPEILKMTDEEALRYLDFMGELVESVDDSPTDIDEGYNLGGRVGFMGGGMDAGNPGGGFGMGVGPDGVGANPSGHGDTSSSLGGSSNNSNKNDNDKDKDKDKKSFKDTVKDFVTNPNNVVKGLVSLGFGLPGTVAMGLVSAAEALGMDVGPAAETGPDRGGRADERRIAEAQAIVDTEIPLEMMFGGDPLKQQTYQKYIDAGYPEDQARLIADSLMTNFTA